MISMDDLEKIGFVMEEYSGDQGATPIYKKGSHVLFMGNNKGQYWYQTPKTKENGNWFYGILIDRIDNLIYLMEKNEKN